VPKPKYIEDSERDKRIYEKADKCLLCIHFGTPHHKTRRRTGERVDAFECSLHAGCFNTVYSIACEDWTPRDPSFAR